MDEDEAIVVEYRAFDPLCAIASSPSARFFKTRLRNVSLTCQVHSFWVCCKYDFANLAKCVLAIGVSPNSFTMDDADDSEGYPVLCVAAKYGAVRVLKLLLEAGANVRLATRPSDGGDGIEDGVGGFTALHEASMHGRVECVRLLLKARAPTEARTVEGITPLLLSAEGGEIEVFSLLLRAGASIHARDNAGDGVLSYAACNDRPRFIDTLLDTGSVDIEGKNNDERTALGVAAWCGSVGAIARLLERGADPNACDDEGDTALMCAIVRQQPLAVAALLPVTDLGVHNLMGRNALHLCAMHGTVPILDLARPYFPKGHLDVGTRSKRVDYTCPAASYCLSCHSQHKALHLAVRFGEPQLARALARHGASRTALDSAGHSALHFAAYIGDVFSTVRLLGRPGAFLMSPAEVNIADEDGCTALHEAARVGRINLCGVLIQAGARLDATNCKGKTPLEAAQEEPEEDSSDDSDTPPSEALLQLLAGNSQGPLPGTACERCAAVPDSQLMHCAGCYVARYCCPRCAAADWPRHAEECKGWREEREEWIK